MYIINIFHGVDGQSGHVWVRFERIASPLLGVHFAEEEAAGAEAAEPSRGGKPARDESSFRAARSKMRNGGEMPQMVCASMCHPLSND